MARRPQPRHMLAQQAKRTEQLLRALESLIALPENGCAVVDMSRSDCTTSCRTGDAATQEETKCLRCAIAALLHRHREPAN